jgi:hypothetical protein
MGKRRRGAALSRVKRTKLSTNERRSSRNPTGRKGIDQEELEIGPPLLLPQQVEEASEVSDPSNASQPSPQKLQVEPPASPKVQAVAKLPLHSSLPCSSLPSMVEHGDGTITLKYTITREQLKTILTLRVDDADDITGKMPWETPTKNAAVAVGANAAAGSSVLPPREALVNQPVTYRRSPVDFSNLPVRNLDVQAFRQGSKNANSARVAKHRAVMKIVGAVKEAGTFDQQSLALQGALVHPDLRSISKSAGYCPEVFTEKVRTASYQINQAGRLLKLARTTNKKRGRCTDVKDSLVQSVMTAVAPSPNSELGKNGLPTRRQLMVSLGFEGTRTGASRLLFSQASRRREQIRELQVSEGAWSIQRKKPKKVLKVHEDLRGLLDSWIRNHEMVVESPIKDETLLVFNPLTGIKERKAKLLLCIPVRELHNDLLKDPPAGLAEAKDANNKCVISDTMLRSLLPPELKPATKRHKQMCGCETCLSFRSHHCSLNAFRDRHIKFLDDPNNQLEVVEVNRLEEYRQMVHPEDTGHWHKKPADAVNEVMCAPVYETLRHFKCALRRCENCPAYPIPLLEQDATDDAPRIIFTCTTR